GQPVRDSIPLAQAFFNPEIIQETGLDPVLKYLASDNAQEIDTQLVDSVRNFLFGPPGAGGFDLAALNIQRGRDHGLADYNSLREAYGLPRVHSYADISSNPDVQARLLAAYGQSDGQDNVDAIDPWLGGLAEDHVPGSSTGPLIRAVLVDQFRRLRDGDRFFYLNNFSSGELSALTHTRLSDVIKRNTQISNVQDNVFFFKLDIGGQVFNDLSLDGVQDPGEPGLAGWSVQLLDETGATVLATATTDAEGHYGFNNFDGLALGTFQINVIPLDDWTATNETTRQFTFTRGNI